MSHDWLWFPEVPASIHQLLVVQVLHNAERLDGGGWIGNPFVGPSALPLDLCSFAMPFGLAVKLADLCDSKPERQMSRPCHHRADTQACRR